MKMATTFENWECEGLWKIQEGIDTPTLAWENKPGEYITNVTEYAGGEGTKEDPYLIATAQHLNAIGLNRCDFDKYFKLSADIDMDDLGSTPFNIIGSLDDHFTGTFDGDGKIISNFYYVSSGKDYIGLFGYNSGTIEDVSLVDVYINSGTGKRVAPIAAYNPGEVYRCYVQGQVMGTGSYIGGIAGMNHGVISDSYTDVEISANTSCGGLVGINYNKITNSYTLGTVTAASYAGGLVGYEYDNGQIYNSFSAGQITATSYAGGILGYQNGDPLFVSCFWDSTINLGISGIGNGTSAEVIGETTANMQMQSTFLDLNWDFVGEDTNGSSDHWRLCEDGSGYPKLSWQTITGDFDCPDGVADEDLSYLAYNWLNIDPDKMLIADAYADGIVNMQDLLILCNNWLDDDCGQCNGADIVDDDVVDFKDFAKISEYWNQSHYTKADLDSDRNVILADIAILADNWLDSGCGLCNGADIIDDDTVDFKDFAIISKHWLKYDFSRVDLNTDGDITLADFAIFSLHWLEGTAP